MMTREQALAYIISHEKVARRDFMDYAKKRLHDNFIMPPEIRAKFLSAGGSYGEFKVDQDWHKELESEVWDGVMYAGLNRLREEMYSKAEFIPHAEQL